MSRSLVSLGMTLALSLTGCQFLFPTPIEGTVDTQKETQVVRSVGTPYRPGEVIKADVFFDGVLAGQGQLKVGAPCRVKNQNAVLVTTSGSSAGLARFLQKAISETSALVDVDSSRPIEAHSDATIGDKRAVADLVFDRAGFTFKQVRSEPDQETKTALGEIRLPIDETPHDGHSVLGYLRNWKPEPGTAGFIWAVFGRYPWRADLVFVGPEMLKTERGEEKALRIDGIAVKLSGSNLTPSTSSPKRPFTIWISDDERKTPLRILLETSLAKVTVEIASYSRVDPKPVAGAQGIAPCTPLFDEKVLRGEVRQRKDKIEAQKREREAARAKAMGGKPSESDKTDDDDQEEKDALERLLKQAN